MMTPKRNPQAKKLQPPQISENLNPNVPNSPPLRRPIKSPSINSAKKAKKSAPKTPINIKPPPPPPPHRPTPSSKKKSSRKKPEKGQTPKREDPAQCEAEGGPGSGSGVRDLEGSSKVSKMKSLMLEEAMSCIPEPGAGRVMHLVKAFERLLSIPMEEEEKRGVINWALPGYQQAPRAEDTEISPSSLFSSPEFERGSSVDGNGDRLSWGSSCSDCDKRGRSKSACSSGRSWNKKLKATSQQPFKLRTEQRGRFKEEHFIKKVKEMFLEEEKQRIPIAQGLPWTTEYPECLAKPFVKESTEPVDPVLHSDARAIERAEFDHHIAERMRFIEQMKLEREKLQKLEEEKETRRLRKKLVPRAQPMPYFDRPFAPKKSRKHQAMTKEPRLRIHQTKEKRKQVSPQETD